MANTFIAKNYWYFCLNSRGYTGNWSRRNDASSEGEPKSPSHQIKRKNSFTTEHLLIMFTEEVIKWAIDNNSTQQIWACGSFINCVMHWSVPSDCQRYATIFPWSVQFGSSWHLCKWVMSSSPHIFITFTTAWFCLPMCNNPLGCWTHIHTNDIFPIAPVKDYYIWR